MPIRGARPLTYKPTTLSDARDGTNAPQGAMSALINLIPAAHTSNVFVPRPAAQPATEFAGYAAVTAVTGLLIQGTRAYGMISSGRFPGHDEPFCFDFSTQTFVPVNGATAANTPQSPPTTGDWTPPVIVAFPSRIIVTHPGYTGANGAYFGWFDISSFTNTALKGNTTSGSAVISSVQTPSGTSAPILSGVEPGQTISGPGIPAGATVVSAANGTFSENTTGNYTSGSAVVTGIPSTAGFAAGMTVTGPGAPLNAVIQSVDSSTQITMSGTAIASATAGALDVSGGGSITISAPATATANAVALSISGGTASAPLWGAGNTNTTPLSAPPACVGQFNGRAYYGVKNYAVFSDSLNPTQVTNANQALTLGDSQPITALIGLPLTSQVTGGTIQALIAFKGAQSFYQITGDASSTSNPLSQSAVTGSVGTLAPNTIAQTPLGLIFVAVDGVRILGLTGTQSDPIGSEGKGVNLPFLNALYPSRMCAAYNQNVYRISVQNGGEIGDPWEEYWFDFDRKVWTGPHTFPFSLIASYDQGTVYNGFVGAPVAVAGSLWRSGVVPNVTSAYTENGVNLSWTYRTVLCPDNQDMANNQVIETSIMLGLSSRDKVNVRAINEVGTTLNAVYVTGISLPITLWGRFKWGGAKWTPANVPGAPLVQYPVHWTAPIDFKQMQIEVTGLSSSPGQAIGNLYVKYQPTGFLTQGPGVS